MNFNDLDFKLSNDIFEVQNIPFDNIHQYLKDYTFPGDYIIPVTDYFENIDYCNEIESEDYVNKEDLRLIKVYRHENDTVELKNIKKLGGKKGLFSKLEKIIDNADFFIKRIPSRVSNKVAGYIQGGYDNIFRDKTTNHIVEIYFWVPVWNVSPKQATVVSLLKRVHFIFT